MAGITAHPWLLSVTESVALPPQARRRTMPDIPIFDFRERLVLMPIFFGLLIAAAVVLQR
jgi:hypothetical protein